MVHQCVVQALSVQADGFVPTGCVVNIGEFDLQEMEERIRIHLAVVDHFENSFALQNYTQPRNCKIIASKLGVEGLS